MKTNYKELEQKADEMRIEVKDDIADIMSKKLIRKNYRKGELKVSKQKIK